MLLPFKDDFEVLFCKSFSRKQNERFLGHVNDAFARKRWVDLLKLMEHTQRSAVKKFADGKQEDMYFIRHSCDIQVPPCARTTFEAGSTCVLFWFCDCRCDCMRRVASDWTAAGQLKETDQTEQLLGFLVH